MRKIHIPSRWWLDGALAGLAGGLAMALFAMASSSLMGTGPWWPANMVAAALPNFQPVTPGFSLAAFVTGGLLHVATAALLGVIYAGVVALLARYAGSLQSRSYYLASATAPAYGFVTWLVAGLLIAPRFNPALTLADQTQYLASHLVFGLVACFAFAWLAQRDRLRVTFAPEVPVERRERLTR